MKSRISSFRIAKELWRKQTWLFALTCLMYFILCTIPGMLSMNMTIPETAKQDFLALFATVPHNYGPSAVLTLFTLVTVIVGTAAGINAFSYLHSKTKVDFYHGMPVSRTRLYLIQAGICLVDYLLPAIVFINLLLLIGTVRGIATGAAWMAAWEMILAGLALLTVCYAMACLATRFETGRPITPEGLARVERAEEWLAEQGFRQLRVRVHGDLARLELDPEGLEKLRDPAAVRAVHQALHGFGFRYVTVDLGGYRMGSMNAQMQPG